MDREALYKEQSKLSFEIERTLKKTVDHGYRSTSKEEILQHMNKSYNDFNLNHKKIVALGVKDDNYFKNNSKQVVDNLVIQIKKNLEKSDLVAAPPLSNPIQAATSQKSTTSEETKQIQHFTQELQKMQQKYEQQRQKDEQQRQKDEQQRQKDEQQRQKDMELREQQRQKDEQQRQKDMELREQQRKLEIELLTQQIQQMQKHQIENQPIIQQKSQRESDNLNLEVKEQQNADSNNQGYDEKTIAWLGQYRREIFKLQDNLLDRIESDSIYLLETRIRSWQKQMDTIKQLYIKLNTDLLVKEDVLGELEEIEEQFNQAHAHLTQKISILTEQKTTMELEKIKIPHFYGNIQEWSSFHDLYKKFVHEDTKKSSVEKLLRLKTLVKGDAFKLIQHLPTTESNYQGAWDIIVNRYDNKRILFSTLIDKILDQPNIIGTSATHIKILLDTTRECVQALNAMGVKTQEAGPIIARVIIRKLDKDTILIYEQTTRRSTEIQALDDVFDFLEQQYRALEAAQIKKSATYPKQQPRTTSNFTQQQYCFYCRSNDHRTFGCGKLLALQVKDRNAWARTSNMCKNCLAHRMDKRCLTKSTCQKCGKLHHTILHFDYNKEKSTSMTTNSSPEVLLATAQVRIKSVQGEYVTLRALIDQGSQSTSISEEAAQILRLPRIKANTRLHGLGDTVVGVAKSKLQLEIQPRFLSQYKLMTEALILPSLASAHPDSSFRYDVKRWHNFNLADPSFNKSDRIDLVFGADVLAKILEEGIHREEDITGQNTKLGWILSGSLTIRRPTKSRLVAVTTNIEKFWEIEEVEGNNEIFPEDDECLKNYDTTTIRGEDGKFIVQLPFKEERELGDSYKRALARFINLEKKLHKNHHLRSEYIKFMKEYITMGHMEKITTGVPGKYYLPHQAVVRENSKTTKVRVVFDASCKTSNGKSLNDILCVGPKLQQNIFDIITKWRKWQYVISADVEKMFRQINVAENDQQFQYILWRENSYEPLETYKLTTVTYGTASAPFLAIRTLHEIGNNCTTPHVAQIIKDDFYMDDLLTGADTTNNCKQLQLAISSHMDKFGFHLRKWISNSEEVLKNINSTETHEVLNIQEDESLKTLGLQWNPQTDIFTFTIHVTENKRVTKRLALSYLARIFDPIGWLAPVTVTAKLFIQHLWKIKTEWDEALDENLAKSWQSFTQNLPSLKSIKINRWLQTSCNTEIQLHGFADASEKAYAAVVYLKTKSKITIVAAKSKVNPIKNRKTLPKLELCAAHLLAKLMHKIKSAFRMETEIFAWSDSTISLAWIKNAVNKDKFIRTRVSEISQLIPTAKWGYVKSKENPADVASRGISPEKLEGFHLWWDGPNWLRKNEENWSTEQPIVEAIVAATKISEQPTYLYDLTDRISSFRKIKRVVAYVLRFIKKLKGGKDFPIYLTAEELQNAEYMLIKGHQNAEMSKECIELSRHQPVHHHSKISSLHPQLDGNGIIRVGGRLEYSNLSYNEKHPIILQKSPLADLIIRDVHESTLHGGNRIMENIIRRKYWIVGVKSRIKKCTRSCPKCQRYSQNLQHQLMGTLPHYRVNISQPFMHTGIDYAGPFQMKCSNGRGQKSFKGYVAVFVCMTTKAVHLEAVSALTTDAFLSALRRFFGRRGKCSNIYSDNGTNFVGAAKHLDKDFSAAIKNNSNLAPVLAEDKIKWHFIPPASPHFGGLWEAAVKSMKYHLKRIIGENKLTYEEFSTLLTQIEAILNSRPLNNMADDNLDVLTPGHFIIGRPMIECPEANEEGRITCLDRWKLLQKLKTHFWKVWKTEYLTTLQQRTKWKKTFANIEEGQVVIIKSEDTHPARWPLGRVTEVHTGKDGLVRVVTLKTENGYLKRPIHKLCPLENGSPEEEKDKVYKPKVKSSTSLLTLTILSLCMVLAPVNASIVKELKSNAAIYLDPMSQINVVSSSWNLVVYYDMKPYFDALDRTKELIQMSREICPKFQTFEDQCWSVLRNIEYLVNKIETNDRLLMTGSTRRKRGAPLSFVGSFTHLIFGLMDEDDRQAFEDNMGNLLANQYELKELAKNQTSVVDATVNILKRTTEEVNAHFSEIKDKVQNITSVMQEHYYVYRESIRFFMLTKQMQELIDECYEVQKESIDVLLDINHGKVHPALISPAQLQAEIVKIRDALPDKLVLPGRQNNMELKEIWHLLNGRGIFSGSRLIIDLKIPLFNRQVSTLYKVIPIPFQQQQQVLIAQIKAPYIVYSYELDSYHFITQAVLNDCKKTLNNQIVCEENFPWIDANTNNCELAPIKPHDKLNCSYNTVDNMPFWIELSAKGNWLFKNFKNTSAHVKCSTQIQTIVQLPSQGILTLKTECTARVDTVTLVAGHQINGEFTGQRQSFLLKEIQPQDDDVIQPISNVVIDHSHEIALLKSHIDDLKKKNIELNGLSFHHMSGHTSLGLVAVVIIVLIIIFIKNILRAKRIATITFAGAQNVQA